MDNDFGQVILVKDINPGVEGDEPSSPKSSEPRNLIEFNDQLYFTVDGAEIWVSDGTRLGTQLLADINPEVESYGFGTPRYFTELNDQLYFAADDGETGRELWVSDGTTAGTQLLADINPHNDGNFSPGSYPEDLTSFKNQLYFSASDGENGSELWVSDGTTAGTQLLADIYPGQNNYPIGRTYNIYSSSPRGFVEANNRLYFRASNGEQNYEPWVTDGTTAGTQLLADIVPGQYEDSFPKDFVEFNNRLYFTASTNENGRELWVSDGTTAGTQLLTDIAPGSTYHQEGAYYGLGYYGEPYYTQNSSDPRELIEVDGKLFFTADDGDHGIELWVSDGTAEGTQLVTDINLSIYGNGNYEIGSRPYELTEFNGKLYFTANDGESGRELYVSDGTAEGTQLVADINPDIGSYPSGSHPSYFTELNGKLYFTANDGEHGNELWVTDGTTEGTQLVADIKPQTDSSDDYRGSKNGSSPRDLTVVGDELFFTADDGENGRELFKLTFENLTEEMPILINGTSSSDNLLGSDSSEQIIGLGGKDTIDSGGGNDILDGGDGDDYLTSNRGKNSFIGGNGHDSMTGGEDDDTINGGKGKDSLFGQGGNDQLRGNQGDDLILGNEGDDFIFGNAGNDGLFGNLGQDSIIGGEGDDSLAGEEGDDSLWGGEGNDHILGNAGNDIIQGSLGNDTIFGLAHNDLIYGGDNRDSLAGGEGDDTINGGSGDDFLFGQGGNDQLEGNQGDDLVLGNDGDDSILGGAGNDGLFGNLGQDSIIGGEGDDSLAGEEGNDSLWGEEGKDHILGNNGNDIIYGGLGNDTIFGLAHNDLIYGGDDRDSLVGGEGDDTINGERGDDRLFGQAGNDLLAGNQGNDWLFGGEGDDTLIGGAHQDIFNIQNNRGLDTIADFQIHLDTFGLRDNLTYEDLVFTTSGTSTLISNSENIMLSIVKDITPDLITEEMFAEFN